MSKIKETIDAYFNQSKRATKAVYKMLNHSSKKHRILARLYNNRIYKRYSMHIHPRCQIGEGLYLPHPLGIVIGKGAKVGKNVEILHNVTLGQKNKKFPTIEDNVVIFSGSVIVGDITVGHDSIISPNAVVIKDVEPYSVVSGNPATLIKKIDPQN